MKYNLEEHSVSKFLGAHKPDLFQLAFSVLGMSQSWLRGLEIYL